MFREFPKIARLNREMVVTEKIDGTNACVIIEPGNPQDDHQDWCAGVFTDDAFVKVGAQSRTRVITPDNDNYGFAKWVYENADTLVADLGPGYHYGEWWGQGIQRRYAMTHKQFSLFNVKRWGEAQENFTTAELDVVPVLYRGLFNVCTVNDILCDLKERGSMASPGFMKPEGVVVYHTAGNVLFKATIEKDDEWKGKK